MQKQPGLIYNADNNSTSIASTSGLRVLTYNTHHCAGNDKCTTPPAKEGELPNPDCSLDMQRLADVVLAEDPDILAMQEVDRFWARSAGVDQPAELSRLLGMNVGFGANLVHCPDVHSDVEHEYGVATATRFPIISCTNHILPTTEGWEPRGVLEMRIDVPELGEIAVLNTHLQVALWTGMEEAVRQRREQAKAIADLVAEIDVPVVLMGDFNTEPNSGDLEALIGAEGAFTDAWTAAGEGEGHTILDGTTGQLRARIDYILVPSMFDVKSVYVVDNERSRMSSDHLPVAAQLTVRN